VFALVLGILFIRNDLLLFLGAVDGGHLEVVRVLLSDKRVDPTVMHNVCARTAAEMGFLEVSFPLL